MSTVTGEVGWATQVSTKPAARCSGVRQLGVLIATSPARSRTTHSPQLPTVHEYGIGAPAASPADSSVSPGATVIVATSWPSSTTVIGCGSVATTGAVLV